MNKILISGLAFPVTAYFEAISRAFKKIGWEVKTFGPYFGTFIPWTKKGGNQAGMIMPDRYDFRPDYPLPQNTTMMPIKMVENLLGDWQPDIYLDCNSGFYLSGKPSKGLHICFLGDPHVLGDYYRNIVSYYDYIFNPQTPYLLNLPNEYFLSYACDSDWCQPLKLEKTIDVLCIGNIYPQRVQLFDKLNQMGIKAKLELGIAKMDLPYEFGSAKICLNWSTLLDTNARVYESMAAGILPIMNRVPDLMRLFKEGENFLGFDNENEAIEQIKLSLSDNELCQRIIQNNLKIRDSLLWETRVKEILGMML